MYDDALEEDVVYWSIDALLSKVVFDTKTLTAAREHVSEDARRVLSSEGHTLIHQYDLDLVFTGLSNDKIITKRIRSQIMRFLTFLERILAEMRNILLSDSCCTRATSRTVMLPSATFFVFDLIFSIKEQISTFIAPTNDIGGKTTRCFFVVPESRF